MLRVDASRLRADFDALSEIGATKGGGVSRPTFSDAHLAARTWFLERARDAGLETRVDPAGNHSAIVSSPTDGARTLLLGSHLDSVPDGGRFDGALGVVAALEVLRTIQDAGVELPITLSILGTLGAGHQASWMLSPGTAVRIMTGAPVPDGADSVQQVELTHELKDGTVVELLKPVEIGKSIVKRGAEIQTGETVQGILIEKKKSRRL